MDAIIRPGPRSFKTLGVKLQTYSKQQQGDTDSQRFLVACIHGFGSLFINIGKPHKPDDMIVLYDKKRIMPFHDEEVKALGHGIRHADGLPFGWTLDEVFYLDLFGLATQILERTLL